MATGNLGSPRLWESYSQNVAAFLSSGHEFKNSTACFDILMTFSKKSIGSDELWELLADTWVLNSLEPSNTNEDTILEDLIKDLQVIQSLWDLQFDSHEKIGPLYGKFLSTVLSRVS